MFSMHNVYKDFFNFTRSDCCSKIYVGTFSTVNIETSLISSSNFRTRLLPGLEGCPAPVPKNCNSMTSDNFPPNCSLRFSGQYKPSIHAEQTVYYGFAQRECLAYIVQK